MFPRFAICLIPLIIVGIMIPLIGMEVIDPKGSEGLAYFLIFLVAVGALVSGFFVARLVFRSISEPQWWKVLASILVFIAVAIGYVGIGFFGGCFLLIGTAK
ncbi:MAG: hypothetical protein P1U87_08430 [Verrucomicrobiales bacterium]|nr:hypothetical protein [Verrucomicrobiales bacterium]